MIGFYRRTLDVALRFQFMTLMVFIATVSLTIWLYIIIPKGFFPTQDTGIIIGITEVAQDASYNQMARLQQAGEQDRAEESVGLFGGVFGRRGLRRSDRE